MNVDATRMNAVVGIDIDKNNFDSSNNDDKMYITHPTIATVFDLDLDFHSPEPPPLRLPVKLSGQGMWRKWTRVFESPVSAFLDLLDNCFDATLDPPTDLRPFQARVEVDYLKFSNNIDSDDDEEEEEEEDDDDSGAETFAGITIMNNSYRRIKSLDEVLTLFNHDETEKTEKKTIGENGVGLKQGCAALSDTSFVLTKNPDDQFFLGVIAKAFQTQEQAYLPSFSFQVDLDQNTLLQDLHKPYPPRKAFENKIREEMEGQSDISCVIAESIGDGDLETGVKNLAFQFFRMCQGKWENEDNVFQVVLCNLNRSSKNEKESSDVVQAGNGNPDGNRKTDKFAFAKRLLDDLKRILPQKYINVSSSLKEFDFHIDGTPVHFSYWERRLAELTKFTVLIPTDKAPENIKDNNKVGYELDIYCGFDPIRLKCSLETKHKNKKKDEDTKKDHIGGEDCSLHVYSRRRLIVEKKDARIDLGLSASGAYNRQGLTVLVDDVGELPLTPTKQGIAWNEQEQGEVHERNFFKWVGAVANCFWDTHFERIKAIGGSDHSPRSTGTYNHAIGKFADSVEQHGKKRLYQIPMMRDAKFTVFHGVVWQFNKKGKIRRANGTRPRIVEGPDTLFKLTDEGIKKSCSEFDNRKRNKKSPNGCDPHETEKGKKKTKKLQGVGTKQSNGARKQDVPDYMAKEEVKERSTRPRRSCRQHKVDYDDDAKKCDWEEAPDDSNKNGGDVSPETVEPAGGTEKATEPLLHPVVSSSEVPASSSPRVEPDNVISLSSDDESVVVVKVEAAPAKRKSRCRTSSPAFSSTSSTEDALELKQKYLEAELENVKLKKKLKITKSRLDTLERTKRRTWIIKKEPNGPTGPRPAAANPTGSRKNDEDYSTDPEDNEQDTGLNR